MSNGHIPNHNNQRRERLEHHLPLRWRTVAWWDALLTRPPRWVVPLLAAALAVTLAALAATLVHHAGKVHGDGEHSHAATAREVTPQACDDALAKADDGFKNAQQFGEGMASFHTEALALAEFLEPGDAGRPVKKLQERLNEAGADIEVDGDYGPKTRQAVEEFTEKHGKHAADSEAYLDQLADTREAYAAAAEQCRGGES